MHHTSKLTAASAKKLSWSDTKLTLLLIPAEGPIVTAHTKDGKIELLRSLSADDTLLVLRSLRFPDRQEALVIDKPDAVLRALTGAA